MKIFDCIYNKFLFALYKVKVGKNFKCDGRLVLQGRTGEFQIGNNVRIISKELVNPVGGNRTVLQSLCQGKIVIGNNVGISHAILCARESIIIEDDVLIGGGVKIFDNDFHAIEYEYRMQEPDCHVRTKPIKIKKGAFIGAGTYILKGVTIGEKSVVGAGSVVCKDIPDNEIWAGNPAKKVK